jgi:hypothetical protein
MTLSDSTGWEVNLNLPATSFEGNISGVRALVDFAITSLLARNPHLLYVSSIAMIRSTRHFRALYCPLIPQSRF